MGDRADGSGITCVHKTDAQERRSATRRTGSRTAAASSPTSSRTSIPSPSAHAVQVNDLPVNYHYLALLPHTEGSVQTVPHAGLLDHGERDPPRRAPRPRAAAPAPRGRRSAASAGCISTPASRTPPTTTATSSARIMSRAGLSLSVTAASARASDTVVPPHFVIDADTSAHTAMRQALAFLADRFHVNQGSSVEMKELVGGEASDYSLGNEYPDDPSEHPITRAAPARRGRARRRGPRAGAHRRARLPQRQRHRPRDRRLRA